MPRMTITLMLVFIISLISLSGYAATKAGTTIVNQAQASYFDTKTGQIFKVLSNYATFVVSPVLAVQQDREQAIKAISGQIVYFPHTIINTGNMPDHYQLTAENTEGDNGDLQNLKIYLDDNGDGQVNPGEQELTRTDQLRPDGLVQIVVVGTVPNQSQPGDQYSINVATASQTDPTIKDADRNIVTTTEEAVIRISRTTDTDCSIPLELGDRSYHVVNFTNIGKQQLPERNVFIDGSTTPISGILIEENIPDYMTLLKTPAFFSEPTGTLLLVGTPLGEWLSYENWNSAGAIINKLAVLIPADKIKPNQSGKFGYTYQVSSLPRKETRLSIETTIDTNNDGRNDFQSNLSCNTVKFDKDTIIKERPDLVLSGTVFHSGNLIGVPGATVTLLSGATDNAIGTTNSDAEGYYEFTGIEAGEYYIRATPPTGYEESSHPPDYFTTYTVFNASYGLEGFIASNTANRGEPGIVTLDPAAEAIVIDIPLDRKGIRGQIAITKTTSTKIASLGEPVAYTVSINNLTEQDLYATYIEDLLPPGFKYLNGTAKINGQHTTDPLISYGSSSSRTKLRFRVGDFMTGTKHELSYITQVTALATTSDGINTAFAHGDTITDLLVTSPKATAKVDVGLTGVISDQAIMFGRVAVAKGCQIGPDTQVNASGFPLAGVRLYMEDGTYVITDPNGQYSLYGLQPGVHVLKVDNHSLPEGVQLALTDNAQAGDPDSRFVDLTPGDFYRADFVAACPETPPAKVVTHCIEQAVPQPVMRKAPPPKRTAVAPPKRVAPPTRIVTPPSPKRITPPPMRKVRHCVDKPVEKKITTMVTRTVNNVIAPVHFASGKANIPPDYINKLKQLIRLTKDKKNVRFKFTGHTDNQRLKPSTKRKFSTNQGLSEARANQVAQFVLQRLNLKTRVSIAGFGDTRPAASNKTPEGMAKNRRVELVMMYDEPKISVQRSSTQVCSIKTVAALNRTNRLTQAALRPPAKTKTVSKLLKRDAGARGPKQPLLNTGQKPIVNQPELLRPLRVRAANRILTIKQPTVTAQTAAQPVLNVTKPAVTTGSKPVVKTIKPAKPLMELTPLKLKQSVIHTTNTVIPPLKQRGKKICETKTMPVINPVIQNILARSKMEQSGWHNEVQSLDPSNAGSLQNLSHLAGKDGDISNGLIEAHQHKVKKQQYHFAREQAVKAGEDTVKKPRMPDPKMVVKTLTNEQGKTGTWLWPIGDASLDGRFMAIVRAGVTPTLFVNDEAVSVNHLGEQIENKSAKAQVLAWYGVELREGENNLTIKAKGPFGNERVLAQKMVKRPSSGVAIKITAKGSLMADGGRSTLPVNIQILDRNGYPAKGNYFLTLENSDGRWAEPDIQDKVPGHQIKVTNGLRTVHLRSSAQSGQIKLRASTGKLQSETDVAQIAELRPLVAVGLLDLRAHQGYRDGYENLGLIQLNENSEAVEVSGRATLFMKGRIRGDKHLTLSYDSEKDNNAELLRDIDPGEYYRVYGDSSIRGFEAQSRSPLYLKLEKDRHSTMWGDFLTDNGNSDADIARSQRTLTGSNSIFDNGQTRVQLFGALQDNMRGFEEILGNGTAMQYQLQDAPIVKNSEVIEIITRDRANIGLIIASEKMHRFRDYSLDDYTGYLSFHRVIPSLDEHLNPVSIRISYDRIEEGEAYLVAGVRLLHSLSNGFTVGASYTRDEHDTDGYQIAGVHTEYKDEITEVQLGVARMAHNDGRTKGDAVRLKISRQWTPDSRTELIATQADTGYSNSSSGVINDRREIKLSQHQKLTKNTEAKLELSDSEALSREEKRQSAELSTTTKLGDWKLKGGVRHIRQTTDADEERINTAILGVERNFSLLGRTGNVKAEYEREIGEAERQRASIGADMQLTEKTRAYIRYERADRLSAGTLAGAIDTKDSLVAGVKSQVLPSTEMYSEYRIEGDISGQDVVAANGAKATLNLEENLVVTPSIEFLNYLEGSDKENSVAASIGIRDTRDPNAKKLLRAEARYARDEKYYGLNGTYVQKITDNTTVMVQDTLRLNQYDDGREDSLQNTLTLAAAHRPTADSNYNALYAYKWDINDTTDKDTHILSTHQHYRINESLDISGRLGAKKQTLKQSGDNYSSDAIMLDARAQWDVTDRISLDVHGGILGTNGFTEKNYAVGAGVNVHVFDNVQIGAGYNFSGFIDEELDPNGRNAQGMYLGLQLKADEALFAWLSGDEHRLVNADCEPERGIEITRPNLLEKQRRQLENCQYRQQQVAPDAHLTATPDSKN